MIKEYMMGLIGWSSDNLKFIKQMFIRATVSKDTLETLETLGNMVWITGLVILGILILLLILLIIPFFIIEWLSCKIKRKSNEK